MANKKVAKSASKKALSRDEAMERIQEILAQTDAEQAFVAVDFGKTVGTMVHLNGDDDMEKLDRLTTMLVGTLVTLLPSEAKDEDRPTQGGADLGYLLTLDILQKLLRLGATDFAEISEDVMPDGDTSSWIDPADIQHAIKCEEPLLRDDEEDKEADDEEVKKFLEETLEKIAKKHGKTFKTKDGEMAELSVAKLSKEDSKELLEGLAKILGKED